MFGVLLGVEVVVSPKEYKQLMLKVLDKLKEVCNNEGIQYQQGNPFYDQDYWVCKVCLGREVYMLWNSGNECGWQYEGIRGQYRARK